MHRIHQAAVRRQLQPMRTARAGVGLSGLDLDWNQTPVDLDQVVGPPGQIEDGVVQRLTRLGPAKDVLTQNPSLRDSGGGALPPAQPDEQDPEPEDE